jgi:hypothetical protein
MAMDYKALAQKVVNTLTNYSHMAIGSAYAAVAIIYHLKSGKDLGPNFVTFSAYFYGFLMGHAGIYQKWPDKESGTLQ